MEKHPVKQIKVEKILGEMLEIDEYLYVKIMDTPGFAAKFNQLCIMASCGDNWYDVRIFDIAENL